MNQEIDTQKLKNIELQLFQAFLSVCEQLKLTYYVVGGTLLGAVRHKGFIPWDDDIDISMPRGDYEIFINEAQRLLPENYFVQTNQTDAEWPANYCKIRNSDTTFLETSVKNSRINHGVFIDIFPLDFYPEGALREKIFLKKNRFYGICISRIYDKTLNRRFVYKVKTLLTFYISPRRAVMKREKLMKSVKDGKRIINWCGVWGAKEIAPREWYQEGTELEFEGFKVIGPKEYDKWLTHVYGDYMQLPPKEERVTHHYTEVIDLERPYTDYMDDLNK